MTEIDETVERKLARYTLRADFAIHVMDANTLSVRDGAWSSTELCRFVDEDGDGKLQTYLDVVIGDDTIASLDDQEIEELDALVDALIAKDVLVNTEREESGSSLRVAVMGAEDLEGDFEAISVDHVDGVDDIDTDVSHLVLATSDTTSDTVMRVNEYCLEHDLPWSLIHYDCGTGYLITFHPTQTACAECLDHRINANVAPAADIFRASSSNQQTKRVMTALLERSLRRLPHNAPSSGTLIEYDADTVAITKHTVYKVPQCTGCGAAVPRQNFQEFIRALQDLDDATDNQK